ncbi:hypothetical protein [Thermodesulfovibrio yellowstonii]|uniref:hypothetical protein n=1 Tax=Thermodesulfovibrio yellowstonii TaxID=28262 RepID=UPI003C7C41E9
MKAIVIKDFKSKEELYEKGTIINIDVSLYHKLSLKGLVKPYLPHIQEEQIPMLTEEFKRMFNEFSDRIEKLPITASIIKEHYPEHYQKLRKLEEKMDEAWLTFERETFIEALREIEEIMRYCFRRYSDECERPSFDELRGNKNDR